MWWGCGPILLKESKKYQDWSYIYKDRNQQGMKYLFFLKIVPMTFYAFIPVRFSQLEAPLKFVLWYGIKLHCCNSFNVIHVVNFNLETNIQFRKKFHGTVSNEYKVSAFLQSCVAHKSCCSESIETGSIILTHNDTKYRHCDIIILLSAVHITWSKFLKSNASISILFDHIFFFIHPMDYM